MPKQTAIEWLEEAGVDCAELRKKLNGLSESHAEKIIVGADGAERSVPSFTPDRKLVEGIVRPFMSNPAVDAALAAELVEEFFEQHEARGPVRLTPGIGQPA